MDMYMLLVTLVNMVNDQIIQKKSTSPSTHVSAECREVPDSLILTFYLLFQARRFIHLIM